MARGHKKKKQKFSSFEKKLKSKTETHTERPLVPSQVAYVLGGERQYPVGETRESQNAHLLGAAKWDRSWRVKFSNMWELIMLLEQKCGGLDVVP